ncbi:MAG: PHB depolymerase family esterase [Chitinophagales bacterium]|nr:PHB depolymerase family esterase [Chitinophagales bacterium]
MMLYPYLKPSGFTTVLAVVVYSVLLPVNVFSQGTAITNFGSNPGDVNAWKYVPSNMPSNAPLVVVMHGCTQSASSYSTETAWNTLAETHKFYVAHIGQKSSNNSSSCFNYWEPGDHNRNQGEGLSIKQVTDYMKANYSIDSSRVFATGLSAGGAMTVVMLAAYPDVFAAGAEMAGLPYKVATSSTGVYTAALGLVSKTPAEWGDLVRAQFPGFTGTYPRLAIFHGTNDNTINKNNATELVKQFTNLHGTDQTADYTNSAFNGNSSVELKQYKNNSGKVVVEYYSINGMGHGIAVDPGSCYQQGGTTASYAIDVNLYSSFWSAYFFGILQPPYSITGLITVNTSQQGVTYSVPNTTGSTFAWTVPSGATIASGQGSNSITVNWGSSSGNVTVVETKSNNCKVGPIDLYVTVGNTTPPLSVSATSTNATGGNCNGTTTANATGGTTPYSYAWNTNPAQTTQTATGLCAGTYTVTVTDNAGNTATASATVTQTGTALSVSATSTNATGGNCNGTTTANATGGTTPYSYAWNTNPAQTTQTATGLCAGTYTVTVTDNAGNTVTASATVTQTGGNLIVTTSSTNATVGNCDGTVTATASGGTLPYNYTWSSIPVQTTETATGLCTGNYFVTVTDAGSGIATGMATVAYEPTSSNSLLNEAIIQVYPNPNNGKFLLWVTSPQNNVLIEIFDMGGKVVYTKSVIADHEQQHTVNLTVPQGVYYARIQTGSESVTKRVVIIK